MNEKQIICYVLDSNNVKLVNAIISWCFRFYQNFEMKRKVNQSNLSQFISFVTIKYKNEYLKVTIKHDRNAIYYIKYTVSRLLSQNLSCFHPKKYHPIISCDIQVENLECDEILATRYAFLEFRTEVTSGTV